MILLKILKTCEKSEASVQFLSSVAQLCPTLCDPMDCSTPGIPVHHQLPEFTQIHVHWVSDAIQPSHPLSSPAPPTSYNYSEMNDINNCIEEILAIWTRYEMLYILLTFLKLSRKLKAKIKCSICLQFSFCHRKKQHTTETNHKGNMYGNSGW